MRFILFSPLGSSIPTEPAVVPKKVCSQIERLTLIHVLFICKNLIVAFFVFTFWDLPVQVVALYPFQAIESGDISLEKVIELGTHIFLVGPVIPLSSLNDALSFVVQKRLFNCVFPFRVKNTKWSTILRNTGGKSATSLGMLT